MLSVAQQLQNVWHAGSTCCQDAWSTEHDTGQLQSRSHASAASPAEGPVFAAPRVSMPVQ
jgi:hypothetical protein